MAQVGHDQRIRGAGRGPVEQVFRERGLSGLPGAPRGSIQPPAPIGVRHAQLTSALVDRRRDGVSHPRPVRVRGPFELGGGVFIRPESRLSEVDRPSIAIALFDKRVRDRAVRRSPLLGRRRLIERRT
jgi:hypothetical protein